MPRAIGLGFTITDPLKLFYICLVSWSQIIFEVIELCVTNQYTSLTLGENPSLAPSMHCHSKL